MNTQQVEEIFNQHIVPILDRYGAKLVETHYGDLESSVGFGDVVLAVMEFRGELLEISIGYANCPKLIDFLLKNWDTLQEIVEYFRNWKNPFYSDITNRFNHYWKKGTVAYNQRQMAYGYVCDKLRALGIRIWS